MQLKTQRIKLAALAQNTGQVPGLPSNPRQWTKEDIDTIAKSLKETPELFEARPIIAVPFDGKYVILGGNLRYEGAKKNGDKDVPVCIIPEDTPVDKMKEIVIKDNGSFGAWDYDALANEWDDNPLGDWGVPAWNTPADNLPEELDGLDLTPDDLPKIQGSDETAMERIIICYRKADEDVLAAALGLERIDKVVYDFAELKPGEAVQVAENEKNGEK